MYVYIYICIHVYTYMRVSHGAPHMQIHVWGIHVEDGGEGGCAARQRTRPALVHLSEDFAELTYTELMHTKVTYTEQTRVHTRW